MKEQGWYVVRRTTPFALFCMSQKEGEDDTDGYMESERPMISKLDVKLMKKTPLMVVSTIMLALETLKSQNATNDSEDEGGRDRICFSYNCLHLYIFMAISFLLYSIENTLFSQLKLVCCG